MTALRALETAGAAGPLDDGAADALLAEMGARARAAQAALGQASGEERTAGLLAMAAALDAACDTVLAANALDMADARTAGISGAMLDRLELTPARLRGVVDGIRAVAAQPDPLGTVLADWTRPNGLRIQRRRVALGVIGIIFESRPNVTADAAALCVRAGNATILRSGSDAFRSAQAIGTALRDGLGRAGLPTDAVQLVPVRDRSAVGAMLRASGFIDVIVPRGGKALVARVQEEARVPVLAHLEGLCHVYVDKAADADKARAIVLNAKMRRVGVCGAAETLLVDRALAASLLPLLVGDLLDAGCEVRGDGDVQAVDPRVRPAGEEDWRTEYLAPVIAARVVDGVDAAIAHIERYGSHHTDSIVTEDAATAERFLDRVDSGIVLVNASTQFADGGEFGFGAEIGISTGRLHARGPVGAEQLTGFKYIVRGDGQTRP